MELIVFPGYAKICIKNIVLPKQDLGHPPLPARPLHWGEMNA